MHRGSATTSLALVALLSACGEDGAEPDSGGSAAPDPGPASPAWFEEVGSSAGLTFVHASGHAEAFLAPEITCGGAALFDYDGDGDLDAYFVQAGSLADASAGPGNELYRNRGDGTFEPATAEAGVGDTGYGFGCACGDIDADGDIDLYVTNYGPNVLYRNEGDGTFTEVGASAGVADPAWSTSAAFLDFDADGHLDLYVVNYLVWSPEDERTCKGADGRHDYCPPGAYAPATDRLYRGRGDGTFEDVTTSAGIDQATCNGLGVVVADFDGDGRIDVYVANDANANQLWINQGEQRFLDMALRKGCALNEVGTPEAGMGVAAVDVESDGDVDLFMTHLRGETNTFYMNGGPHFRDRTVDRGLGLSSRVYTGFGVGFADFDHDAELDLYIANGRVAWTEPTYDSKDRYAEPNQLYVGVGQGRFEERMPVGGTATPLIATSRAAAFGDVDGDGAIDVVVVDRDAPAKLLRNVAPDRGAWVLFRVLDRLGRDAVGSVVVLEVRGMPRRRLVQVASSYLASNDPRVHFGLGDGGTVGEVRVEWLGGGSETFGPFAAGGVYELREGAGR